MRLYILRKERSSAARALLVVCGPACHRVFVQGGKARGWEGELEATERRLRDHLDMLVKSETLQGQTRDRARTQDRLQRRTSFVIEDNHARKFWDKHFIDQREVIMNDWTCRQSHFSDSLPIYEQVSIDNLCEALTFEYESTKSDDSDIKPAIKAVRQVVHHRYVAMQ